MRASVRRALKPVDPRFFNRSNLFAHQRQPYHVAPELLDGIRRQPRSLGRSQRLQTLRRLTQMRLEALDAEPGEGTLHAVDNARTLADQALTLAARAPRVLLLERGDRHHPAMTALAAQP